MSSESTLVLLVEDDPQFAYLIQRYAQSSGCEFIWVNSTSEAASQIQQALPDLILLDLALSGTDDWQALQALKANPVTCKIPVFVCSSSEVAAQGWEEYAEGCLLKPIMYEDFVAALAATSHHPPRDAMMRHIPAI